MSLFLDCDLKRKDAMKKFANRNIRFILAAISVVRSTHPNPYSNRCSKKNYTRHQHLVPVLFKYYRNRHYREFIEDFGDWKRVLETMDLLEVPHSSNSCNLMRDPCGSFLVHFRNKTPIHFYTKKLRNRSPAKNFQSPPYPLPEIFQADLDCISRTLTPENQKFCSMYMRFVA